MLVISGSPAASGGLGQMLDVSATLVQEFIVACESKETTGGKLSSDGQRMSCLRTD